LAEDPVQIPQHQIAAFRRIKSGIGNVPPVA
jgi:hypothetical protein